MRYLAGAVALLRLGLVAVAMACSAPAVAVEPDEVLSDPALEARARHISAELRCLVCQNQSIDDSNAPLARDLRLLVRERLKAGDSDAEVRDFVVARYGEFVLLRPPLGWHTLLLWLTPFAVLAAAGLYVWRAARTVPEEAGARESEADLDAEEQAKLARVLAGSKTADERRDRSG